MIIDEWVFTMYKRTLNLKSFMNPSQKDLENLWYHKYNVARFIFFNYALHEAYDKYQIKLSITYTYQRLNIQVK